MYKPELLLLDEPTSGLDPLLQQEVLRLIKEAKKDGATVFFSSHIIGEVEQVAERIGIIREGVVVEVSETQMLMKRALRMARVRFTKPQQVSALENLTGVKVLSAEETTVHLQIEGEMDALIKALG